MNIRLKFALLAIPLFLSAGYAWSDTIISVTETHYDSDLRPDCVAVRMNSATFSNPPANACSLGTTGSYGQDRVTKTIYDADGRISQIRRAVGTSLEQAYVTYTYNGLDEKTSETDANGNKTTYLYDDYGRLAQVQYPSTVVGSGTSNPSDYEAYAYDSNGNKTSWRRRDGQTIGYSYDHLNREIVSDAPGTVLDIYTGYDLLGRTLYKRFGSTGGSGVSHAYDGIGRVTSTTDMNGRTLSYAYNQASARTMMWYPDGNSVGYTLDVANRVTAMGYDAFSGLTSQTYDSLGRLTAIGKGGGWTLYGYDAIGRLNNMTNDLSGTADDGGWSFTFNPASQIASTAASSTVYDYKETANNTVNQTYDGLNRDAAIAAVSGGYDARGNMTNDGSRTFTYDIYNRLLTGTGTGTNLGLTYDPEGRLASYTSGATVTQFLYDGVDLIGEYNSSGAVLRRYIHGSATDDPLAWYEGGGTSDLRYMYTNYQGSVIAYTNSSGVLQELYKYGPYGEPKDVNNNDNWSGTRFRYTGQLILPEARLYYYKARVYDPIYGRFLQTDPIGSKDDLDLYAYVGADPINKVDPTGTQTEDGNPPSEDMNNVLDGIGRDGENLRDSEDTTRSQRDEQYEQYKSQTDQFRASNDPDLRAEAARRDQTTNEIHRAMGWDRTPIGIAPDGTPIFPHPGGRSMPDTGEPDSWITGPRQDRKYNGDGLPEKDVDWTHSHGQGRPHVHDYDENGVRGRVGRAPTNDERGVSEGDRDPDTGQKKKRNDE